MEEKSDIGLEQGKTSRRPQSGHQGGGGGSGGDLFASLTDMMYPQDAAAIRTLVRYSMFIRIGQGLGSLISIMLIASLMSNLIGSFPPAAWGLTASILMFLYSAGVGYQAYQVHQGGGDKYLFTKLCFFGDVGMSYIMLSAFSAGAAWGHFGELIVSLVLQFFIFLSLVGFIPYAQGMYDNVDLLR